jgi:hypothetical protein
MTLVLTILRATPSLNNFANLRRQPWRYPEIRRIWSRAIRDALLEARIAERRPLPWPRPPHERVHVRVTRYAPEHQWLDQDNLAGGLKPLLDALKAHELIADDTTKAIDLEPRQEVSPFTQPTRWTEIHLSLDPPLLRAEGASTTKGGAVMTCLSRTGGE